MAKVDRVRRWFLPAGLALLTAACGSQSANPNALPSWVGAYPGAAPQRSGNDFVFETKDQAEKILDFYQRQLLQNGLHMGMRGGGEYGGVLTAEDDAHTRSVTIQIRSDKGASEVIITPLQKK
jgi:hypothetical protein